MEKLLCRSRCWSNMMETFFPAGFSRELKEILKVSWPIVLTQMCEYYFLIIAVSFGGHLSTVEMAAISLSTTISNVLGLSIIIGMLSSLETFFSQAHGSGNHQLIGILLQRGLYIHLLAVVFWCSILINITPLLLLLGQDPEVAELSGQFLLCFIPGLLLLCATDVLRRYTQCQNVVFPHIYIMAMCHCVHALAQFLLLFQAKLGIYGSALALDLTFLFMFVTTLIYTLKSKTHEMCWRGWDKRSLDDWGPLAKLALYGCLMTCFEWWAFEISIVVAGTQGTTQLGAQSISFNMDGAAYSLIFGFSIATCIRVGYFIGAQQPDYAKTSARVSFSVGAIFGIVCSSVFILGRNILPMILTSHQDVIDLVSKILPVLGLYMLASCINTVGRGIFRGVGWQGAGSLLAFICFYVLAWPIGLPLMICTSLNLIGLWWGFFIGYATAAIVYIIVINCGIKWQRICEKVKGKEEEEVSIEGPSMNDKELVPLSKDETTPLSKSFSTTADNNNKEDRHFKLSKSLIAKRLVLVGIIFGILLGSIVLRLYIKHDSYSFMNGHFMLPCLSHGNITTSIHHGLLTFSQHGLLQRTYCNRTDLGQR